MTRRTWYLHKLDMTSTRFLLRTILHVVLQLLIGSSTLNSQVVRLPDRFEEITRTSFVADNGLYTTTSTNTLRYVPSTQRWVDVFPDRLLAARKSSLLFNDGSNDYLLSTDLGVTLTAVSRPAATDYHYLVRGDTVIVATEEGVFARVNNGNTQWQRIDTDQQHVSGRASGRIHWHDTVLALWNPVENPRLRFYSLAGKRLAVESSPLITSISSTHDFVLFNYDGRISLAPTADVSSLFRIGDSETILCQHGSKLLTISSSGTQAVSHDTGKTWTTRRVFPKQSLDSVRWFAFRDSLYITFRSNDVWYAADTSFTSWSAVNFTNPYPGTHWTTCENELLTWWRNSVQSTSSSSGTSRPIISIDDDREPVAVVTSDRGTVFRFVDNKMYRSYDCGDSWDTTVMTSVTLTAGYSHGNLWRADGGLQFSTDDGKTWRIAESSTRMLLETEVSVHNGSYVYSDDEGLHVFSPPDGFIHLHHIPLATMASYARFGNTSYMASYHTMYYIQNSHWLPIMAAPDILRYQSLRPNHECYYGVDTAWKPIRWRPGGIVEYLDTVRILNAVVSVSGQHIRFTSNASGTYLYRHSPLTSLHTIQLHNTHPPLIITRHENLDLSMFADELAQQPTEISVYTITGDIVYRSTSSSTFHTQSLARGMYHVLLNNRPRFLSFPLLVID